MRGWEYQGQSLVEVVVAAGIIGMAAVVLASAVTRAIANNRLSKERIVATRLAQEGWEWLMGQRGDNWRGLYTTVEAARGGGMVEYCLGDTDAFNREIMDNYGDLAQVAACASACVCPGFEAGESVYTRVVELDPIDQGEVSDLPFDHLSAKVIVKWDSRGKEQTVKVEGTINP